MTDDSLIDSLSSLEKSSLEEHEAYIDAMRQNVGYKPEPEVGIFWFNPEENDIFGIAKDPIDDVEFTANGVRTGKVLHRDYWTKLRNRATRRGQSDGIFFQKYTKVPRGSVFQLKNGGSPAGRTFQINVGSWIKSIDKELLMDLIIDEFNLEGEKVKIQEDEHWNIGRGDSDF